MKKLLIAAVILVLLCSLLAVGVCAEEAQGSAPVMTVDGKEYTDFEEGWNDALAATANNDNTVEVVLLADWTAENGSFGSGKGFKKGAIYISEDTKDMSLDLNGHTIDRGLFLWSDFNSDPEVDEGRDSGEVMHIDEGSKRITVKGGTITGANNKDYGGIYIDKAEVLFENMTFVSNKSDQGGALYNNEGRVSFMNCIFERNLAEYGGAVYTDYEALAFDHCTIKNNCATDEDGGAIYSYAADTTINNCTISNNDSVGLRITTFGITNDGNVEVSSSTFEHNRYAISLRDGHLTVYGSTFRNNELACFLRTDAKFVDCTFTENLAAIDTDADLTLDGCTIENNTHPHYVEDRSTLELLHRCNLYIKDTTIQNNQAFSAVNLSGNNSVFATMYVSGTVVIANNTNYYGEASNVTFFNYNADTSNIFFNEDFSKDSLIGMHSSRTDNHSILHVVSRIPRSWSNSDLNNVFSVDPGGFSYSGNEFYLQRTDNCMNYMYGDYTKDKDAILNAGSGAATISADGSLAILFSVLAIATSVCTLAVVFMKKKKRC